MQERHLIIGSDAPKNPEEPVPARDLFLFDEDCVAPTPKPTAKKVAPPGWVNLGYVSEEPFRSVERSRSYRRVPLRFSTPGYVVDCCIDQATLRYEGSRGAIRAVVVPNDRGNLIDTWNGDPPPEPPGCVNLGAVEDCSIETTREVKKRAWGGQSVLASEETVLTVTGIRSPAERAYRATGILARALAEITGDTTPFRVEPWLPSNDRLPARPFQPPWVKYPPEGVWR